MKTMKRSESETAGRTSLKYIVTVMEWTKPGKAEVVEPSTLAPNPPKLDSFVSDGATRLSLLSLSREHHTIEPTSFYITYSVVHLKLEPSPCRKSDMLRSRLECIMRGSAELERGCVAERRLLRLLE
jgi:hypothetical protein